MDKNLEKYLKDNKISYIEHKHQAVFTVEESKTMKESIPTMHTKCLFLKDENSSFYLVCMNAFKRLDTKIIKNEFNIKQLNFASPEELKTQLNVTPGSVSLFAMIYAKNVKLVIDNEIWLAKSAGFHPNINTSTLEINHSQLEKFINSLKCEKKIISI